MNVHNSSQLGMKDVEHSRSIRTFMHNLKIKVMTKIEEVIKIIENNQNLSTNDLIWLSEVRKHNLSTSTVLVLIEKVRNNSRK